MEESVWRSAYDLHKNVSESGEGSSEHFSEALRFVSGSRKLEKKQGASLPSSQPPHNSPPGYTIRSSDHTTAQHRIQALQ